MCCEDHADQKFPLFELDAHWNITRINADVELRQMWETIVAISQAEEAIQAAELSPLANALAVDLLTKVAARFMAAYTKILEPR